MAVGKHGPGSGRLAAVAVGAALLCSLGEASADPCEARLPTRFGTEFGGTVRYIVDGDGFCVGLTDDPDSWIEVRTVDYDAPELSTPDGGVAKGIAERLLMGRELRCVTSRGRSGRTRSYDRVFATCSLDGTGIGDIMRAAGAPTGGN